MRAIRARGFNGYGDLELVNIPKPEASNGKVLVRMTAGGRDAARSHDLVWPIPQGEGAAGSGERRRGRRRGRRRNGVPGGILSLEQQAAARCPRGTPVSSGKIRYGETEGRFKLGNIVTSADALLLLMCRVHREERLHNSLEYFRTTGYRCRICLRSYPVPWREGDEFARRELARTDLSNRRRRFVELAFQKDRG